MHAQYADVYLIALDGVPAATNTPMPTQAPATTRIEQDHASISDTPASYWYPNRLAAHSGGSATLAMDVNAKATLPFSGSGVRWIGTKDPWSGIAQVYLDGVLQTTVDTYASDSQYQVPLYSVSGLSAGAHTLEIRVTGTRSASAQASWIWIDAFEITSP